MNFRLFSSPERDPNRVPTQYQWATSMMELKFRIFYGLLAVIGTGIWIGSVTLIDLRYKVQEGERHDATKSALDTEQTRDIKTLQDSMARQGTLLSEIKETVRDTNAYIRELSHKNR